VDLEGVTVRGHYAQKDEAKDDSEIQRRTIVHIQFLIDIKNSAGEILYHVGEKKHVRTSVGDNYVDRKEAVLVPFPERGSADWLSARKNLSAILNPSAEATVQWSVAKGEINGRFYIAAKCSQPNCSSYTFDGSPSASEGLEFLHSCGCVQVPEKVPAAIVAQYRKLWKPLTQMGKDEANAAFLARPQKSEPVDLTGKMANGLPLTGPRPGQPLVEGAEKSHLKMFLPNPNNGKHVDMKKIVGPQNGKPLIPGDEITHPPDWK
jgi:hypothetical protein